MRSNMLVIGIVLIVIAIGVAAHYGLLGFAGRGKQAKVTIGGHEFAVEVRDTPAGRAQGLSGRESLGESTGILFKFGAPGNYGFWMKDMKFPIDIIWIRDGEVVGVTENAVPEPDKSMFELTSYYPPEAIDSVLEINGGEVAQYGITVGDVVAIQ